MLKQRIQTALWLIPLALCGFFVLQGGAFTAFVALVMLLGGWEWARLVGLVNQHERVAYGLALVVGFWLLQAIIPVWLVLFVALAWWLQAGRMVLNYPVCVVDWGGIRRQLLMGALILLPAGVALIWLKDQERANLLILTVMLMVWAADIGAYFAGRALGKRKLAPAVSPGKSREGVYGGLVASGLLALCCGLVLGLSGGKLLVFLVAAQVIVVFSVLGDLTESMFKRNAGIKDSSNLLPGHGGVLDRIDSLTAALPLFALFFYLTGWAS